MAVIQMRTAALSNTHNGSQFSPGRRDSLVAVAAAVVAVDGAGTQPGNAGCNWWLCASSTTTTISIAPRYQWNKMHDYMYKLYYVPPLCINSCNASFIAIARPQSNF